MVVFMSMPLEAHGTSPPTLHVIDVMLLLRAIYISKVCNNDFRGCEIENETFLCLF